MALKLTQGIVALVRTPWNTKALSKPGNGGIVPTAGLSVLHEDVAMWAFLKHLSKLWSLVQHVDHGRIQYVFGVGQIKRQGYRKARAFICVLQVLLGIVVGCCRYRPGEGKQQTVFPGSFWTHLHPNHNMGSRGWAIPALHNPCGARSQKLGPNPANIHRNEVA